MGLSGICFDIQPHKTPRVLLNGDVCWEVEMSQGSRRCFVTIHGADPILGQPYEYDGFSWKASDWSWLYRKEHIGFLKSDIIKIVMAMFNRYMETHSVNQLNLLEV